MRKLDGYTSFFAKAQIKQRIYKHTRQSGESNSNKAHKKYLAHIYANRISQDYERVKQALKKDLRHGRQWSILIDEFVADSGDSIPGLGLGLLLLCESAIPGKISQAHSCKTNLLTLINSITLPYVQLLPDLGDHSLLPLQTRVQRLIRRAKSQCA